MNAVTLLDEHGEDHGKTFLMIASLQNHKLPGPQNESHAFMLLFYTC